MTNIIKFQDQNIEIITVNGESYLNGNQIGSCLELAFPAKAVAKIYRKHKKEFMPEMSIAVEMPTTTGNKLTRLYSLRGAALIAMYAQTPVAAQFRAFILDVLEGKQSTKAQAEQIKQLKLQINTLQTAFLCASDLFSKIWDYNQKGLSTKEIARLILKSPRRIRECLQALEFMGFPVQRRKPGKQKRQLSLPFGG